MVIIQNSVHSDVIKPHYPCFCALRDRIYWLKTRGFLLFFCTTTASSSAFHVITYLDCIHTLWTFIVLHRIEVKSCKTELKCSEREFLTNKKCVFTMVTYGVHGHFPRRNSPRPSTVSVVDARPCRTLPPFTITCVREDPGWVGASPPPV